MPAYSGEEAEDHLSPKAPIKEINQEREEDTECTLIPINLAGSFSSFNK